MSSDQGGEETHASSTTYTLLPFVREGFRPNRQYDPGTVAHEGRNEITVRTGIEGRKLDRAGTETRTPQVDLRMYGPGDISGIDDRQVVTTVPRADTTTFPPNYFPHIEFDRPDLPWLFSPESANRAEGDRLRPWLALVVVPKSRATVEPPGTRPNAALTVSAAELPPVTESWAWAHVQAVGDLHAADVSETDRQRLFTTGSDQTVSRLLCPRKLSKGTRYVACVVPTFEPGRKTGLGEAPFGEHAEDETPTVGPAWDASADGEVTLPIYYRWEFTTGDRGDFEAALDRLAPRNLSKPEYDVGYREFDLAEPGPAPLRTTGTATAKVSGALTTIGSDPREWAKSSVLHALLNDPDSVIGTPQGTPARNLPVVGPPVYGQWPPMAFDWEADPAEGSSLSWLSELNLSPRYRISAGYGTEVVREHQDRLMDDAWSQFDQLEDSTRNTLDRYNIAREIEREVQGTLERIGRSRQFRDIERVREAVRLQGALDRLHGDGLVDPTAPGGGVVDPEGWRTGFERDVVDSVLRNGGLSTLTEDVLGTIEGGLTQPGGDGTTQPLPDETIYSDGITAHEAMGTDYGSFLSMANELGAVREKRELERTSGGDLPTRPDGGGGAVPERIPAFGSLSRLDAVTRAGGVLARRASQGSDMPAIRDALFAEGAVPDAVERPDHTEQVAPEWLLDDAGDQMTLSEALESLEGGMQAVPKALIQLQTLREDTNALERRLGTVEQALGDEDDRGVPAGQATAAEIVTDHPPLDEAADIVCDLVDAAHTAVSKAVAADLDAVSPDLTWERTQTGFERMATASNVLAAATARLGVAARRIGEHSGERNANVHHEDVAAAREATTIITSQTEALVAFIPTEVPRQTEPNTEESLPGAGPTAPTTFLYDEIPLQEQPNVPGMLAGERWTVAKAGQLTFETDFSTDSVREVDTVMRGGPMAAPEFDWPMYEPLKELSAKYILPGVGNVPNNTLGALTTNRKFIEAYMAGLSHEFARELLWREYPTDRRGTHFRTFWNYDGPGETPTAPDIEKIHRWDGELGSNAPGDEDVANRVVLLVKGDLLQAFPNTRIYMVPAVAEQRPDPPADPQDGHDVWDRKPLFEAEPFDPEHTAVFDGTERPGGYAPEGRPGASFTRREDTGMHHVVPKEPVVHGKLGDGVTFLLFDLDTDAARGRDFTFDSNLNPEYPDQLGWFFVFEEPVGEIRFGFDANDELVGEDDEQIRTAAHPSGPTYDACYTDVGSYPAAVDLGPSKRRGTTESTLPDGCDIWQEEVGEETGWSGLSWGHIVKHGTLPSPTEDRAVQVAAEQRLVDAIGHVRVEGPDSHAPGGVNDGVDDDSPWSTDDATWGKNSADMARIAWQHPVRAAYHVDDLLPDDTADVQREGDGQ